MSSVGPTPLATVFAFLARLEHESIFYTLSTIRPEFLLVSVAVPGQRWEVEFGPHGEVEVEVFISTGEIGGPRLLDELIRQFGEQSSES